MVLNRHDRKLKMAESFQRVVVEIDVRGLDLFGIQAVDVHGKSVILGGDFHLPGSQILDRLVAAAVAEFELEGFPPRASAMSWMPRHMPKIGRNPISERMVSTA